MKSAAIELRHAVTGGRRRGVTLIELLVGLVIGLLVVAVITQVLSFSSGQARTTMAGADAQVNGSVALFTLKRDVEMSGYGIASIQAALGCTIRSLNFTAANGGNRTLAPVIITNGAAGAPDTLRVHSSLNLGYSLPARLSGVHSTSAAGSDRFVLTNTLGFEAGDLVLALPSAPTAANTCTIFRVNGTSANPAVATGWLRHDSGAGDANAWNGADAAALLAIFPVAGYDASSNLVNLGPGLLDRTYSISATGGLQVVDFDNATVSNLPARELFPQIVNLQALYGKDTSGDGSIDVYDNVQPTTSAQWRQVIAIRLAVVARAGQFEKEIVTPAALQWNLGDAPTVTGSTTCASGAGQCLAINVDTGMAANTDWQRYRYKLYDTIVPLRNVIWYAQ
jgi:type IV pilus assembly protein PilW